VCDLCHSSSFETAQQHSVTALLQQPVSSIFQFCCTVTLQLLDSRLDTSLWSFNFFAGSGMEKEHIFNPALVAYM
jgi:hypothetical protein